VAAVVWVAVGGVGGLDVWCCWWTGRLAGLLLDWRSGGAGGLEVTVLVLAWTGPGHEGPFSVPDLAGTGIGPGWSRPVPAMTLVACILVSVPVLAGTGVPVPRQGLVLAWMLVVCLSCMVPGGGGWLRGLSGLSG
jgi:hypothetical protein